MGVPFVKQLLKGVRNSYCHLVYKDIFDAVRKGDNDALQRYLSNGGKPRIRCGEDYFDSLVGGSIRRYTLLHYAIHCNRPGMVSLLVEHGADVNSSEMDATPLALALQTLQFSTADFLLSHNADINGRGFIDWGTFGYTPLIYLCDKGVDDDQCEAKLLAVVRYIFDKGANIHIEDTQGYPAIAHAITKAHVLTFEFLVQHSDDASLNRPYDGVSLLQHLCKNIEAKESLPMLSILLNRSVDVNRIYPRKKETALSILEGREENEAVKMAIDMLKGRGAHS